MLGTFGSGDISPLGKITVRFGPSDDESFRSANISREDELVGLVYVLQDNAKNCQNHYSHFLSAILEDKIVVKKFDLRNYDGALSTL